MQRIMMRKNSMMNICENYDKIVNYHYDEHDTMTKMLIDCYRDSMETIHLDNMEEVKNFFQYDQVLSTYLENHKFYKMVQMYYHNQIDWGNSIIENMNQLYQIFQEIQIPTEKSKWL